MSNQVIIHKKSAVADKKPTTEQLQYGELAINTHDGKLYTKVDDGVERVINLASKPAVASDVPPANPEDGSLWFDTSDVSLNIYYDDGTSAQWISITDQVLDLSNSSIGELFDIDITSNAPTNGQALVWDGTKFVPGDSGTDLSTATTDNLSEGSTNLYYTDARVQTVIDTNTAGFITDYTVTQTDVTTHQAALSITESQISDLGTYATETYVDTAVSNLVDAAPETLDTLNELAAALGDDANFSTTVTNSIALKANSADLATVATSGDYNDLINTPAPAGTVEFGTTAPASPSAGDFWYNENVAELFVYDGTNWITTADGVGDFFTEKTTNDLVEGSSNKYYTDARVQTVIDANTAGFITSSSLPTAVSELTNDSGYITTYTVTQADVTQHQAALSITESQISDLQSYLTSADISSLATETYVDTAVSNLVDAAPETLDTLNELAAALGDDANFSTTVTNSIALKANSADLATVATSGDYADLINTPTLFDGDYNSLSNTPTIPSVITDLGIVDGTNGQILSTDGSGNFTFIDVSSGASVEISNTAPVNPDIGSFWFDTTDATLNIYYDDGTSEQWIGLNETGSPSEDAGASVSVSATEPSDPSEGDLWYDTVNVGLFVYDGTQWVESTTVSLSGFTADDLAEGSTNLYYTDAKVQAVIDTNTAGFITDYTVTEADVTTHQAALSITESQISDLSTYATETYVNTAISNLVDSAPTTLDTLNELAAALGDDANFSTTITNSLANKVDSSSLATVATSGDYNDLINTPAPGGTVEFGTTAPASPSSGDFWYNENVAELFVYDGTNWITTADGVGDFFTEKTTDNLVEGSNNKYYTDAKVQAVIDTNTAGFITTYSVTEADVTTHQAALTITESQISDLGTYLTSSDLTGYATETYVDTAVSNLVDAAPTTLDTLNELAAALGDDANFSTTITNSLANKANTGDLSAVATSGDYTDLINTPTIPSAITDLGITDGTTGQVLSTDGAGNFTFADAASGVVISGTAPSSPSNGDLWYDTTNVGLFIYIDDGNSAQWIETSNPPPAGGGSGSVDLSAVDQSIIPSADITYDLGSPTNQWRDIYVGPGSLYVNGTKVIEDNAGTINVTADENQSIRVGTTGTGQTTIDSAAGVNITSSGSADITLTTATGQIELNGDVVVDVTKSITSSTGAAITFNAPISVGTNTITAQNFVGSFSGTIDDISNFTADDLAEGSTNLYYTDAKVQAVIDTNTAGYTTETYVDTAVANLVDTAPAALDTLNELAAALGDDANFATTVTNSLAAKVDDFTFNVTNNASGAYSFTGLGTGSDNPTLYLQRGMTYFFDVDSAGHPFRINTANTTGSGSEYTSGITNQGVETGILEFTVPQDAPRVLYYNCEFHGAMAGTIYIIDETFDYNDLSNTPTLFDGDYNSLSNTPTIPAGLTDLGITDGTNGQVLATDGNGTFTFVDAATGQSGGASVSVAETAPSEPSEGDLWFNSSSLELYIYYSNNWIGIDEPANVSSNGSSWLEASDNTILVAGGQYLADSTGQAITLTLPASPSMGDEIRIVDAGGGAGTNNITIDRNGNNISGLSENLVININEAAFGLVYFNATRGWVLTEK